MEYILITRRRDILTLQWHKNKLVQDFSKKQVDKSVSSLAPSPIFQLIRSDDELSKHANERRVALSLAAYIFLDIWKTYRIANELFIDSNKKM